MRPRSPHTEKEGQIRDYGCVWWSESTLSLRDKLQSIEGCCTHGL